MSTATHLERPGPDRFMRRLLVVGDEVDRTAIFGARRSTSTALIVSGVRCTITYLLIPIFVPFIGLLSVLDAPIGLVLSLVAVASALSGLRRFWIADHRARWTYTAFIAVVMAALAVAIVFDVSAIVAA